MPLRWKGLTFTWDRIATVAAVAVLFVLGVALPYLRLRYLDLSSEQVDGRERLFGAADLVGGLDPTYLVTTGAPDRDALNLALNVLAAGPGIHQVAAVVTLLTCWGLFYDEINKFLFWPLHASGYLLVLAAVPLLIGVRLMRSAGVTVSLDVGWVPLVLLGALVLVVTLRARRRLDTYGGV